MYPSLQASARSARETIPWSSTSRVPGSQRKQSPAFLGGQLAPLAGRQVAKLDRADGNSHEAQGRETDGRGHSPDLAAASLAQRQPKPGGGHVFAEADWHRTIDDKLQTLDDLYQLLNHDQTNRWMLILEVTIVLLFVIDLVILLLGFKRP